MKAVLAMGLPVFRGEGAIRGAMGEVGGGCVVIDALVGTGLSRDVSGGLLEAIREIKRLGSAGAPVVAVDCPSGLAAGAGVPRPEAVVDTVIAHAREHRWFVERDRNACNVLDVVHPLWLCAQQVDYRREEIRDHLAGVLHEALGRWVDGAGFAFAGPGEPGGNDEPGLQGTEMWLSIIWLAADALGESDGLSWRPRGVHRPEPAGSLAVPAGTA